MQKVEQKGDRYYINGEEVEFVKGKPERPKTPGEVWANVGWKKGCPIGRNQNDCAIRKECGCYECSVPLAAAFDAGLAAQTMMTVEEWWEIRCAKGGLCDKVPCKNGPYSCSYCETIGRAYAKKYRQACIDANVERKGDTHS